MFKGVAAVSGYIVKDLARFTVPCFRGCPDCELDVPPDTCACNTRPYDREPSPVGDGSVKTLDEKLATFDRLADRARDELVRLLTDEWEYVKRMAAGRHANGHFLFGDSLMYEYDQPRLLVEAVEELADGINYTVVRLSREG